MITWGIPSHKDKSDITGTIHKGQILADAPKLLR
jgi:hypothetical protein